MNFDYKKFELELKEKTRATFIACTGKLDIKDIAGFALYSDNSAMTMSVSCNTYEHLKKELSETPGHDIYLKFTPGEWKYELINAKEFKHLCDLLRDAHFDKTTGILSDHRNKIYSIAVKALGELKVEDLFKNMNDDFFAHVGNAHLHLTSENRRGCAISANHLLLYDVT